MSRPAVLPSAGSGLLASRTSADGKVTWQARRSPDRGRLVVVGVVAPSETPTVIEPLSEGQLRALLEGTPAKTPNRWICAHCGKSNGADRQWCAICSEAS